MNDEGEACEVLPDEHAAVELRQTLDELISERAALRRLAGLLAGGVAFHTVPSAVCEEVGTLLDADASVLVVPTDGGVLSVASWSRSELIPVGGTSWPLTPESVAARVIETGRP
jgi:hypothetical protein